MTRTAPSPRFFDDRVDRRIDQLGAVVDGRGADVGRQGAVHVRHLRVHGGGDGAAVGADQHHGGADTTSRPFMLAAPVRSSVPTTTVATSRTRTTVPPCSPTLTSLRSVPAFPAGRRSAPGTPRRGARRIPRRRLELFRSSARDHVGEGQAVADELHRVGLHDVLLLVAAEAVDVGDALDLLELRADDPVLHGAQVRRALHVGGRGAGLRASGMSRRSASRVVRPRRVAPRPPGCS